MNLQYLDFIFSLLYYLHEIDAKKKVGYSAMLIKMKKFSVSD